MDHDKLVTAVPAPIGPVARDDGEHFPRTGRVLMLSVLALGVVALARRMSADGVLRGITLDTVNLMLVLAGLLLFGTPLRYARTFTRSVTEAGGILLQTRDAGRIGAQDLTVVTKRPPNDLEMADLLFAFRVAKHVKSNAIVYVRAGATVGVGAGQMSRVDSARIAALKAREAVAAAEIAGQDAGALGTRGSVVASDAFFPFADGLITAIEAGATAVIQPGGSVRDDEVIAAADDAGVAMVFTGMRHFRH